LVPCEQIVQIAEFESEDPAFAGEMRITASFADVDGVTEITMLCEHIPKGMRPEDDERGRKESLQKLAAPLE
jgi:hypothetical protein